MKRMPNDAVAISSQKSGRRCPSCAARTASAMKVLLTSRIAVFAPPRMTSVCRLAAAKVSGIEIAIDRVAEEESAEEEHLGREEDPHPELRGLALLAEIVELLGKKIGGGGFGHPDN